MQPGSEDVARQDIDPGPARRGAPVRARTGSPFVRAVNRMVDLLIGLLVLGALALSTYVLFLLKGGH